MKSMEELAMRLLDQFTRGFGLSRLRAKTNLDGRTRLSVTCHSAHVAALRRHMLGLFSRNGMEVRKIEVAPIRYKDASQICITIAYASEQRHRLIELAGLLGRYPATELVRFGRFSPSLNAEAAS